jgi:hypothetical protein
MTIPAIQTSGLTKSFGDLVGAIVSDQPRAGSSALAAVDVPARSVRAVSMIGVKGWCRALGGYL